MSSLRVPHISRRSTADTSTSRPPRRSTVAIALTAAAIAGVVAGAGTGSPVVAAVAAALVLACVLLAAVMI